MSTTFPEPKYQVGQDIYRIEKEVKRGRKRACKECGHEHQPILSEQYVVREDEIAMIRAVVSHRGVSVCYSLDKCRWLEVKEAALYPTRELAQAEADARNNQESEVEG